MGLFDWHLIVDFATRLFLAAFLGSAISFRRSADRYQLSMVEAHAFLSTAGALFMMIIAGEIIRAVGLLGAASIVRYRYAIRNPRDAGTLVVALGLGMACGSGLLEIALVGAVFILIVSRLLKLFPDMLPSGMVKRREEIILRIQTEDYEATMAKVQELFDRLGVHSVIVSFERKLTEKLGQMTEVELHLDYGEELDLQELTRALMDARIRRFSWHDVPDAVAY